MFKGKLLPFQEEAFERMVDRQLVLVGYHMGLGKTVITLATIEHLYEAGEVETGLVVVPASLKYQWKRQIEAFTDAQDDVLLIEGTPVRREMQWRRAHRYTYVICNYEQVLNDWSMIRRIPWNFVVCDEVTAIKSTKAKRSKKIKQLDAPYKFGLTGQPVENKAEEIFSIMQWIDPDVLGRYDIFDRSFIVRDGYGNVKYYRNMPRLHRMLGEAMVRKTYDDVKDQLPKVREENVYIDFDAAGRSLYRKIARDLLAEISEALTKFGPAFNLWQHYNSSSNALANKVRGNIMSRLLCMRMLCDHPELLTVSAKRFKDGLIGTQGVTGGSKYAYQLQELGLLVGLTKAPKLEEAKALIQDILEESPKSKVVLFSFFKPTLHLLKKELSTPQSKAVLFMGGMSAKEKDAAKQQFDTDPHTRLFLSSDAGGYGLDLPAANYLINYDLPWSTGKLDQRNARIVRLSSTWGSVAVLTTMMRGSIEERMFDMLRQKRSIAAAIVDGRGADAKGRLHLSLKSLSDFLRTSSV